MMATLKAEFRKLLTVRSTYVITSFVVGLVIFVAFYALGWRLKQPSLSDPTQIAGDVIGVLNIAVFGAIVAILSVTHEYRYNTIMYTLTNSNSRTKVLFAKFVAISAYALFLTALVGVLTPAMVYLGVHLHGNILVPQTVHLWNIAWRSLFFGWGSAMAGLLIALFLRNQVASIAALFVIPNLVEQLLGQLLLKHNAVYLPFSSLDQVISMGGNAAGPTSSSMSPGKAAGVFCIYLVTGWVIAWVLFLKRDAN